MSRLTSMIAAVGAAAAVVATASASAVAAPATTAATTAAPTAAPATHRVIVRPVTAAHRPAAGYRIVNEAGPLDCGMAPASPVAVSANIVECAPDAAYPVACWHAVRPRFALCMFDPASHRIARFPAQHFSAKRVPAPKKPAPFVLVLDNGARCKIRDGGAWGFPKQHPNWVGYYSCTKVGFVYAARSSLTGINESHPSWTVWTSLANQPRLHLHHVRRAVFVGTKQ